MDDGIADMGGTDGWGRTHPPDPNEPVFAERWQGRVFALVLLSMNLANYNVHAFRHEIESLGRDAYLGEGYFGRWLNAVESMLTKTAILAPGAIDARVRNMQGGHVEEAPAPEPRRPDFTPPAEGSLRTVDTPPAFSVGERVRAKNLSTSGHTRLPRFFRGHAGVIEVVQPAAVLPDTMSQFKSESPQYTYSVRFDSRELWGPDTEPFTVTGDLYESYLEKIA
jgi:nitrile hydratase beta subunit